MPVLSQWRGSNIVRCASVEVFLVCSVVPSAIFHQEHAMENSLNGFFITRGMAEWQYLVANGMQWTKRHTCSYPVTVQGWGRILGPATWLSTDSTRVPSLDPQMASFRVIASLNLKWNWRDATQSHCPCEKIECVCFLSDWGITCINFSRCLSLDPWVTRYSLSLISESPRADHSSVSYLWGQFWTILLKVLYYEGLLNSFPLQLPTS